MYDIYLIGVGGQGLLTIGEVLAEAATGLGIPVSLYPYKGMAQRGGQVRAQLRLGREGVGPNIPPRGADLVLAMEVSEALRALRFLKPGGEFLLYGEQWLPTAVMLGKAPYPSPEAVMEAVRAAGGRALYLPPEALPADDGGPLPANIYALGAALGHTRLREHIPPERVEEVLRSRRGAERNLKALRAGLEAAPQTRS